MKGCLFRCFIIIFGLVFLSYMKKKSIRLTADQCLEHVWLKQYPKKVEIIETPIQNEIKTSDIVSPIIEVEVGDLE